MRCDPSWRTREFLVQGLVDLTCLVPAADSGFGYPGVSHFSPPLREVGHPNWGRLEMLSGSQIKVSPIGFGKDVPTIPSAIPGSEAVSVRSGFATHVA